MDGDVKSLQDVIQACERDGMVDFELAGHEYSRPAAVMQGQVADQLLRLQHFSLYFLICFESF